MVIGQYVQNQTAGNAWACSMSVSHSQDIHINNLCKTSFLFIFFSFHAIVCLLESRPFRFPKTLDQSLHLQVCR